MKKIIVLIILALIIAGCSAVPSQTQSQTHTKTQSQTHISETQNTPTPPQTLEKDQSPETQSPSPQSYTRKDLIKFKGLWAPPGEDLLDSEKEIKELGVNIIPVEVGYCIRNGEFKQISFGPPIYDPEKEVIKKIESAHRSGFAVFLEINTMIPECEIEISDKDYFIENFVQESKKWAEIAEKYQVELFSPLNEPNLVLGERGLEWAQKVLPSVKEVYKGDVVLKIADRPIAGNYSGYDYLAIDIFPGEVEYWREDIRNAVSEMNSVVKKYGLKGGFIGEIGVPTQIGPDDDESLVAGKIVDRKTQAEIFQTAFEEAWNKTDGFFVLAWAKDPKSTYNFHGFEAENVVRDWYTQK